MFGEERVQWCGGWLGNILSQQCGTAVGIPTPKGHAEGAVYLADSSHALERLCCRSSDKLVEEGLQCHVVQHILAKDGVEALRCDEGRQNDIGEESFGTLSAPNVLLAACVAAAENVEIFLLTAEEHGNLQLGERA